MKTPILLAIGLWAALSSCHQGTPAPGTGNADSAFQALAKNYIKGYLDWRPQGGVALGFHQYDTQVTNVSASSIESEISRIKVTDSLMAFIDTTALSPQAYEDYRILKLEIDNELLNFVDEKTFSTNPMNYAQLVDLNGYIKRDFAPLDYRVRCMIKVEEQFPEMYAQAKLNLEDSLARPLVDMAIEISKGTAAFLGGDLLVALKGVNNDSLMKAFTAVNQTAIASINDYVRYLQTVKLPKSNNHFALGEEKYRKMLRFVEMIDLPPEKVLEIGMAELKKEQGVFNAAAHIINPNKTPVEVYKDVEKEHPTADSLLPEVGNHLEGIRQFLIDHNIITMPSEVRIKVKETPPYARAWTTASCDVPGPFETKATEAYYYVTPVDPSWTPQQKEDWLATFNYYTTDVVTIHEAYPGHYTQFLHLNASGATDVEKIFSSYAYVEGWAHYTEKMMLDEGYGNNGDPVKASKYRIAQSGDALLRICRLCVSIKMHCMGASVDEGTKFFMDNWYQGEKPSRVEAMRGTFDPLYLFYTVGKLEILKLRVDYQQQEGANYSLKKFNDAMVDHGMPPIRLLREVLLKDKSKWGEVL